MSAHYIAFEEICRYAGEEIASQPSPFSSFYTRTISMAAFFVSLSLPFV
jgi:hypothetical protein